MTVLCLMGQDIGSLHIALVKEGDLAFRETVVTRPEGYLSAVNAALAKQGVALSDLSAVAIVAGPGSFTATRLSTTLGNTIAFTQHIPTISWENPDHLTLPDLVARQDWSNLPKAGTFVNPVYDRPPHITTPKGGDNLLAA